MHPHSISLILCCVSWQEQAGASLARNNMDTMSLMLRGKDGATKLNEAIKQVVIVPHGVSCTVVLSNRPRVIV